MNRLTNFIGVLLVFTLAMAFTGCPASGSGEDNSDNGSNGGSATTYYSSKYEKTGNNGFTYEYNADGTLAKYNGSTEGLADQQTSADSIFISFKLSGNTFTSLKMRGSELVVANAPASMYTTTVEGDTLALNVAGTAQLTLTKGEGDTYTCEQFGGTYTFSKAN